MYKPEYPGLYYFDTFTFTTLGASGNRGPDSTKGYANAPWRDGDFSIVDGQQQWTVPATGMYKIVAAGAYGATPGRVVSGDVDLSEGQVLTMLVGQQPTPLTSNVQDNLTVGGGGGTFVVSDGVPLIVASGGDGTGGHTASFSPYGTGNGINGAGYFSNGSVTNETFRYLKPAAYIKGGFGNICYETVVPEEGGFGGGQSPVATSDVSGGGGYTGSPGDGVSGATCYADLSVANFTDLGAASNSAGYVTVSLVDPVPLQPTWSWDEEAPWESINSFQSNAYTVTWCESLGLFVVGGQYTPLTVNISREGKQWQQTDATYYDNYQEPMVSATDKPIIVWGSKTSVDGLKWVDNNKLSGYVVYCNGMFINSANYDIYTSTDGFTWNAVAFSTPVYTVRAYGNNMYVGFDSSGNSRQIVYSEDLVTWNFTGVYLYDYTGYNRLDISFGNSVFVSYGSSTGVYTSTNGISWTQQTIPDDFPGTIPHLSSLTFGGNIFLIVKEYLDNSHPVSTTSTYFYISSDGDTWTRSSMSLDSIGNVISITYSPSLNYFLFLSQQAFPYLTLDGKYSVPSSDGTYFSVNNFTNIVYSPTSDVMVVGNYTSTDQGVTWYIKKIIDPVDYDFGTVSYNVLSNDRFFKFMTYYSSLDSVFKVGTYTSFDGLEWTYEGERISTFNFFGTPFWCQQKGYFIINGKYVSRDGVNLSLLGTQDMIVTAYSETIGLFTGYDTEQQWFGQNYYSYDGYTWNLANESGINPVVWSSSLKLFMGVKYLYYSYEENIVFYGIFVSSDGINWQLSYTITNNMAPRGVTWSPELKKFFVYLPGNPNNPLHFYDELIESSDGYKWSIVQINTVSNPSYQKDTFDWISGLDRFILSHNEVISIRVLFSPKAIKQF